MNLFSAHDHLTWKLFSTFQFAENILFNKESFLLNLLPLPSQITFSNNHKASRKMQIFINFRLRIISSFQRKFQKLLISPKRSSRCNFYVNVCCFPWVGPDNDCLMKRKLCLEVVLGDLKRKCWGIIKYQKARVRTEMGLWLDRFICSTVPVLDLFLISKLFLTF